MDKFCNYVRPPIHQVYQSRGTCEHRENSPLLLDYVTADMIL